MKVSSREEDDDVTWTYAYQDASESGAAAYLHPQVLNILDRTLCVGATVCDVGCGNGATSAMLRNAGYVVTGIDSSESGVRIAKASQPGIRFEQRSAYSNLVEEFGTFDAIVSLEVVEHCYWPRKFADSVLALLKPGGVAIISTPFHGYWKNLAIALAGRFDQHWSPLWDGGHIKFFSERTLGALLVERGFGAVEFIRVGRVGPLAKSMIAVAHRPNR